MHSFQRDFVKCLLPLLSFLVFCILNCWSVQGMSNVVCAPGSSKTVREYVRNHCEILLYIVYIIVHHGPALEHAWWEYIRLGPWLLTWSKPKHTACCLRLLILQLAPKTNHTTPGRERPKTQLSMNRWLPFGWWHGMIPWCWNQPPATPSHLHLWPRAETPMGPWAAALPRNGGCTVATKRGSKLIMDSSMKWWFLILGTPQIIQY